MGILIFFAKFGTRYNSPSSPSPISRRFLFIFMSGPYSFHPHLVFEIVGYLLALLVYLTLRRRFGDPIPTQVRWAVVAAAIAGAAIGSKLLFWFEDPLLTWHNRTNPAFLMGGKTIVGALIFGLITVELIKRYIGLQASTGDLYAIPLALGIAIGRVGCFLTGLSDNTYGTPTHLPWAIDFGDGIPRHPTQLYEIVLLLALIQIVYLIQKEIVILSGVAAKQSEAAAQSKDPYPSSTLATRNPALATRLLPGDAFKFFMVAYMSFRLLCDFIKPYPRIFLGLGGIQWACLLVLLYYAFDIARWLRILRSL